MTKEQQPIPTRPKLTVAAAIDYPAASEVLVSFPNQWELVHVARWADAPLYIAGWPISVERPRRANFHGLPAQVNLALTSYRLYRFFRPWLMPSVVVGFDAATGTGQVEAMGDIKLQLQPLGQAQAWFGETFGVLWECYFHQTGRVPKWQDSLADIWRAVERDMQVAKIFTQPHEPTFAEGYPDFLSRLGYVPDPESPRWWSKVREG
jgi:hypothetical protein